MVPMTTAAASTTAALLFTSSLLFLFRRLVFSAWSGFCSYFVPISTSENEVLRIEEESTALTTSAILVPSALAEPSVVVLLTFSKIFIFLTFH